MKRFLVILLVCSLFVSVASADYISDFNLYAGVFGASEIKDGTSAVVKGRNIQSFTADDCKIYFSEENNKLKSISVIGTGDKFLVYCASAISQFDDSSANRATNYGNLLMIYFLSLADTSEEDHMGSTLSGAAFGMSKKDDKCQFTIASVD